MAWGVADCSERFDTLARRIFSQRRSAILPSLLHPIPGSRSVFGELAKWLKWLLHDSCYDSQVFDLALKDAFGENRRLFGATEEGGSVSQQSGPKVGVVTTSISKSTSTYVIGNFNVSQDAETEAGK